MSGELKACPFCGSDRLTTSSRFDADKDIVFEHGVACPRDHVAQPRKMVTVTLPFPPSVNHYWRTVMVGKAPRTIISAKGRQYKQDVAHVCAAEGCAGARMRGRLAVTLTAHAPDRRARDIDNLGKAALDALTGAGVWLDDAQIDRLMIVRGAVVSGGKLEVCVEVLQ